MKSVGYLGGSAKQTKQHILQKRVKDKREPLYHIIWRVCQLWIAVKFFYCPTNGIEILSSTDESFENKI